MIFPHRWVRSPALAGCSGEGKWQDGNRPLASGFQMLVTMRTSSKKKCLLLKWKRSISICSLGDCPVGMKPLPVSFQRGHHRFLGRAWILKLSRLVSSLCSGPGSTTIHPSLSPSPKAPDDLTTQDGVAINGYMPVFKATSFVSLSCEAVLHQSEGRELLEALFVEALHSRCFFFWLLFCSPLLCKLSKSLF